MDKRTEHPALMTIDAAAAYLALSRSTIYGMIREGRIKSVKVISDAPRIRRADLDRLIDEAAG